MTKRPAKRARQMCSCGHEIAWHDAHGRCRYGHATPTGGCSCENLKMRGTHRGAPYSERAAEGVDARSAALVQALVALHAAVEQFVGPDLRGSSAVLTPLLAPVVAAKPKRAHANLTSSPSSISGGQADKRTSGPTDLSPCALAILGVLAWSCRTLTADYISIYTGYSQSGSFSAALASLRKGGLIAGTGKGLEITNRGIDRAGKQIPFPTGEELLEMWSNKLDPCARAVLECLYLRRPAALSAAQIAGEAGYSMSGSFSAALSTLRKLELVHGKGSALSLHDSFSDGDADQNKRAGQ